MTTILLIEDDALLGAMIKEMLEIDAYTVLWLRSGLPVKKLASQGVKPDLIITDIVMPDMDGLETIQFLRETCPEIPLIAMSAESGTGYLTLASRMGAAAILQKPFLPQTLSTTVKDLLTQGKAPGAQE